jgi:transcriptional regulator with XRE-family HTH domain
VFRIFARLALGVFTVSPKRRAYSSLSTILYKTAAPSIASIERLCTGFGITLAQFFSAEDEYARLKKDEKDCLSHWGQLDPLEKQLTLTYMQALTDAKDAREPEH